MAAGPISRERHESDRQTAGNGVDFGSARRPAARRGGAAALVAGGAVRGARVIHSVALDHPDKVERAALLGMIPTHYLCTLHAA
jgi:hypothetical protein